MGNTKGFRCNRMFAGSLSAVLALLMLISTPARAQYPGDNTVYNTTMTVTNSHAFIDASKLTGTDICAQIHAALLQLANTVTYPAYGGTGVIDARAINPTVQCTSNPWSGGATAPATVLLPAGTIVIPHTWTLPNNTTLVGEGDGSRTTVQAKTSFPDSDMIDLGNSTVCPTVGLPTCNNVSIVNLTLDAQNQSINGIVNTNSQTGSHVDHVNLLRILGTGLLVSTNAQNSGPYTNITFDTLGIGSSSTACAQVVGLSGTKGIHGLTCISPPDSPHAVLLDSSNNTLEDIRVVGFYDGILVGSQAIATHNNILRNIVGDTVLITNIPAPINVVHISPNNQVTDFSVVGINNQGSGNTIWDELTATTLSDPYVSLYVLGKSIPVGSGSAYSRFTTSPNAATWAVGASAPSGSCNSGTGGSIFSSTSGSGFALSYCPVGSGRSWTGIK